MELSLEVLTKRVEELRQAEGMAWAQLHGIQGRLVEAEHLLALLKGEPEQPGQPDDDEPAVKLADILPPGFKEG